MFSFRVTTYNIHKCRGLDRRVRPKRIADVLREINADVVALQEVVGMDDAAREHNQVAAIAEELGLDFCTGENRRLRGSAYGNAVLSRWPIATDRNHDLTWRMYEPRGCLDVAITLPDGSQTALQLFNVHLGTGFFERRYQGHRLLDVIGSGDAVSAGPRVLLGDFNEWTRGLTTRLLTRHWNSAEPDQRLGRPRTYPGVFPVLHLDHVYYNSLLTLKSVAVHRTLLSLAASDHLPIVADFTLAA
ncbi:MAG TPA: endonuclease/exonuclease/phosphatase family protein [Pyrinomonadaceae bacterium]|nr:endonuclease/exonuclease/phosphatase family protein [Pyrinomonadaceae bacterium]